MSLSLRGEGLKEAEQPALSTCAGPLSLHVKSGMDPAMWGGGVHGRRRGSAQSACRRRSPLASRSAFTFVWTGSRASPGSAPEPMRGFEAKFDD